MNTILNICYRQRDDHVREISLDQILADDRFAHTDGQPSEALIRSVRATGILHPVRVIAEGSQFVPVSGFKRLAAGRILGLETMPAFLLSHESDPVDLFLVGVWDNLASGGLTDLEKATVIGKLSAWGAGERLVSICEAIQWPSVARSIQQAREVAALPQLQRGRIADGSVTVWSATRLLQQPADVRQAWFDLLGEFKLGGNRQKELILLLEELSFLRSAGEVTELARQTARKSSQAPHERAALVVEALRRLRLPHLVDCEERFHQYRSQLRLPAGVGLSAPPFFEGNQFHLEFNFRSREQLEEILRKLSEAAASPEMRQILDLCGAAKNLSHN
ncbi:MAG: ParB N-terminal domain-containing protein [Acidobacteriota bacterium]